MADLCRLEGVGEQGNFYVSMNGNPYTVHFSFFCTMNSVVIGEQGLLYKIGQNFIFHKNYYFCEDKSEVLETIYRSDREENFNRKPIRMTAFSGVQEFENCFLSAKSFTSRVFALTLGLCEAALRSSCPSNLVNKIPVLSTYLKGKKTNNFKSIFESFKDTQSLKDTFRDLNKFEISNLQDFCNHYSVGVRLYYFDDNKVIKEFRLPEKPELSPIPLIKFIFWSNFFFLLYDQHENSNDGYNDNGLQHYSYQNGEIESSFYIIKTASFYEQVADGVLNIFKNYLDPKYVNKSLVEKSTNELLSMLSNIQETGFNDDKTKAQQYIEDLKSIQSNLKSAQPNNLPHVVPRVMTGAPTNNSCVPNKLGVPSGTIASDDPQNFPKGNLLLPSKEFKEFRSTYAYLPNNNVTPAVRLASDTPIDMSKEGQLKQIIPNPVTAYTSTDNSEMNRAPPVINLDPSSTNYSNRGNNNSGVDRMKSSTTFNARNFKKMCLGCEQNKETHLFHTCQLCFYCIALSLQEHQCMGCNNLNIRDEIRKYNSLGLKCNGCGLLLKDYRLNSECKCIICRNCENSSKYENHNFHRFA